MSQQRLKTFKRKLLHNHNAKKEEHNKNNPSELSYQERWFSSMANCFIFSSSYPPFNTFLDESFSKIMNDVDVENDFKSLKIIHLKFFWMLSTIHLKKLLVKQYLIITKRRMKNFFVSLYMMVIRYWIKISIRHLECSLQIIIFIITMQLHHSLGNYSRTKLKK